MSALKNLLDQLANDKEIADSIAFWKRIPPREGSYEPFPSELPRELSETLSRRGIARLYSHQAASYRAVRGGESLVVVTPTASGKTLCYNLPIMHHLLENPEARALYLFPTKALSQDQQAELNEVILGGKLKVKIFTYDGDTPRSIRVSARDTGRIIITNPDMLHTGILPNHPKWIKFLSNLRYVVIDEIHTYRGVFGSHMTNLIRRLRRIARFYGADPQFVCCSATIGNPKELTERVVERSVTLLDENGAPSGEKHFILYNPPLVDAVQGIRRGVVHEARRFATRFLGAGVKTIVFARSRIRTELIASYINSTFANIYNDNRRIRVEAYRGGYLPSERRAIERGLREGTVHGVVSTNALELGIDIGGLDAAILAGFPGSIASSWQQAGRSGRTTDLSVALLIASAAPVDQYLATHPEYFFGSSPESGWVDPNNLYILLDHLKCSAFELPFEEGEEFGEDTPTLLEHLEGSGVLRFSGGRWYWSDRSYPAEGVSLRSATAENVVIINTTSGKNEVIGEMDRVSAKELIFDGAVYIHRGAQYIVTKLDVENHKCLVQESDLNYYTDSIVKSDIKVLHVDEERSTSGFRALIGDVLVRREIAKFKKIRYHTHENIGYGEISLPEEEMHTRSVILLFSEETGAGIGFARVPAHLREEAIARIGTLVKNVAPIFLLCERSDLGVAERLKDPHTGVASLYIYDMYPGGTGLSEGFLDRAAEILRAAYDLLDACPCESGCPSCIGPGDGGTTADNVKTTVSALLGFLKA